MPLPVAPEPSTVVVPMDGRAASCILCGERRWREIRRGRDIYRPRLPTQYVLCRCATCGLVAQQPQPGPAELRAAYAVPYRVFRPAWQVTGWPLWKILRTLTGKRRLRRLCRHASGGRLLEVGCGAGDFLLAAQREGWHVHAVELTAEMVALLRGQALDVRQGELVPGLWDEGIFDAIVLWDVLEHVPDPAATLGTAARYLRDGGVVLASFPTANGVQAGQRHGDWWAPLDLPRHLNFLDAAALARLGAAAGLTVVDYETPVLDALWCELASGCRSAGALPTAPRRAVALVDAFVRTLLTLPHLFSDARNGRGPIAVAAAVKR
jgi:SAM-dependent methyltransferase